MTPPSIRRAGAGTIARWMLACLALGGCGSLHNPGRQASAAQQAACRQRADEIYSKQNRAEVFSADTYASSTRDSPFSVAGLPGITSRGLSGRYARDTLLSDCLNDTGAAAASSASSDGQATPGRLPRSLSPLAVPPTP